MCIRENRAGAQVRQWGGGGAAVLESPASPQGDILPGTPQTFL